jgi:hypothetical protein
MKTGPSALFGLSILGIAVVFWQAVDAFRWHARKRLWQSAAASLALVLLGAGSLFVAMSHPAFSF